ncbi:hypothetical protein ACQP2E_27850 [Actinoplanes sp. CA-015351]|uniref:hypothetical protein n=1 Tax=Actinoplanes sp. CA-015351 TaxID=3239897 RepID=UPI003D95E695
MGLFVVCGSLLLSGCSSKAGGDEQPAQQQASAPATAKVTAGTMSEIVELTGALEQQRFADVRQCMADEGFPQLMRAHELSAQRTPQAHFEPLRLDPLEMGPYTAEHARKYGMVGSVLLFAKPEPGSVISEDPAFDKARTGCESKFDKRTASDVNGLLKQSSDLQTEVRAAFLDATSEPMTDLLSQRLACVRDSGYERMDPKAAIEADEFGDMLKGVGIEAGRVEADVPEQPALKKGEVIVVPPSDPGSYTPRADEVKFALAYVECGEKQKFVDELEKLQAEPREKLNDRYEVRLAAMVTELNTAVRNGK